MKINSVKISLNGKIAPRKLNINVGFKNNKRSGYGDNRTNHQIYDYFLDRKDFKTGTYKAATAIVIQEIIKQNKKKPLTKKDFQDAGSINKALLKSKSMSKSYIKLANKVFLDQPKYVYYKGTKYSRSEGDVSGQVKNNIYLYVELRAK